MLIEFSVKNYLSFGEKQTLSMVASQRDDSLQGNLVELSLPGLSGLRLLKTAVLYGANASGKSNLLKALQFLDWFVENSAIRIKPDQHIKVEPFRLNKESPTQPSEFEITFVAEGIRYQFGFVVDANRVYSEWLFAYPGGRPQHWYQRDFNVQTGQYAWDFSQKHFRGAREVLTQQTRENALFLSTAAQFNNEQLLTVYRWFQRKLSNLDLARSNLEADTLNVAAKMSRETHLRTQILEMLSDADLGISSVDVEEVEVDAEMIPSDLPPAFKKFLEKAKVAKLHWTHVIPGSRERISFETQYESAGTLRYFSVLAPILNCLENGGVLSIDELGANIHPLLVRALLKFFQLPQKQRGGAQLILTTHDTTLLDKEVFRRDQIWFTEKNKEGATHLYPLTDFHPRKDESLERGYLAGRYGAVPFLIGDLTP